MKTRPDGLDDGTLAGALREGWGLDVQPGGGLRYLPVGFGDHHWAAEDGAGVRWFVTVTELTGEGAFDELRRAMEVAAWLAGADGLDFVVGPVPGRRGESVRPLGDAFAVAVFPQVEGGAGKFGPWRTAGERAAVGRMLGELHGVTGEARGAGVPLPVKEPGDLPGRAGLEAALGELDRPWTGGPFAEPARRLLARHGAGALRAVLGRFDALTDRVAAAGREYVVTHGEPHPGNVVRSGDRLRLVDWDTVGLAPPERDLWWLATADTTAADTTANGAGEGAPPGADRETLLLYRIRWDLDDLTVYLDDFRRPHRRTADTDIAWEGFAGSLDRLVAAASSGA